MNIFPPFRTALFIPLILSLSACGGGGGGGTLTGSDSHRVSTEVEGAGSISPSSASLDRGTTTDFTLSPDDGYVLDLVEGCPGEFGGGETYTVGPVAGSCTLRAVFVPVFAVTGTVTGLEGSITLKLFLNGSEEILTLSGADPAQSRTFEFTKPGRVHWVYSVKVVASEAGYQCDVHQHSTQISADGVPPVAVTCDQLESASLSGRITPVANIEVDSDINDKTAAFASNDDPLNPQMISEPVRVHGFASDSPTWGSSEHERFALEPDYNDFYWVSLKAGQTIKLHVLDYFQDVDNDLDLILLNSELDLVDFSLGVTGYETVSVPDDGDYLVLVTAWYGISKYILDFQSAGGVTGKRVGIPDFVLNEVIAKMNEKSPSQATSLAAGHGYLTLRERTPEGPGLFAIEQTVSGKNPIMPHASVSSGLKARNPDAFQKLNTLRAIKALRADPRVEYAEPNYIRKPLAVSPNDEKYGEQWHYSAINLPTAWAKTTGFPASGEVIVAVVDTGVYMDHPDIRDKLTAGYDFISDADNARDGDGLDENPDDPGDDPELEWSSWHGTHVAGTVAAATDNEIGVAGVSWGAKVMPLRVLGRYGGTSWDIRQAVLYAAGLDNSSGKLPAQRADVINLSLGGSSSSVAEQDAYAAARAAGVIIVAAAGNADSSSPSYPAAYPEVISVSATNSDNQRAYYSNYGTTIALAAPGGELYENMNGDPVGDGVVSTYVTASAGERSPGYHALQGTSMASPHVAGVLALMKAVYPGLSPDDVDALIMSGAIVNDVGETGWDQYYGFGLMDATKAVDHAEVLAGGGDLPDLPPHVVPSPAELFLWLKGEEELTVENIGGGAAKVTHIATRGDWLQVTPQTVDTEGLGRYVVTVDRTGLATGSYEGRIVFTVDGTTEISVAVFVLVMESFSSHSRAPVYVRLENADSGKTAETLAAETGEFTFNNVPYGNYSLKAGTDIDRDLTLCTPGELCGSYTSTTMPTLTIDRVEVGGLDFETELMVDEETNAAWWKSSFTQMSEQP